MEKLRRVLYLCLGIAVCLTGWADSDPSAIREEVRFLRSLIGQLEDRVELLEASLPGALDPSLAEGRAKFEMYCLLCHKYQRSMPMLAPPIFAVKDHYERVYDDPDELAAAIVDYVKSPSEEASLMPGARMRFGMMQPMPLPEPELEAIARFIVEAPFDKPDWYDQHYAEEHETGDPRALRPGWAPPASHDQGADQP